MKIPHRIRIKPKVSYEVVWVDRFDAEDTLAECREGSRQIAIKKGMSAKETRKTLLHETLHAIEFEWGIDLNHENIYVLEEAIEKLLSLNNWLPKRGKI